jgi:ureidoglycolate hydrolase
MEALKGTSFETEGLLWVYDNKEWCVGIKNYKPGNAVENLEALERHRLTDETFMHVSGVCCLLYKNDDGSFGTVMMKSGSLYTVPRDVWHTTVTKPGAKMAIIERSGTDMSNSEMLKLAPGDLKAALAALKAAGFDSAG